MYSLLTTLCWVPKSRLRNEQKPSHENGSEHSQMSRSFGLTLDLRDDPKLIAEYRRDHEEIWPEITRNIKDSSIEALEIYLFGASRFMITEVNEYFTFED